MKRSFLLPIAAVVCFGLAVWHMVSAQRRPPRAEPKASPPSNPMTFAVAGTGMIEARTENISLGSQLSGVVEEVFVQVGDRVKPGQLLFRLDDRQARATLEVMKANLLAAEAQFEKLERSPREEELPPSLARVAEAAAKYAEMDDAFRRASELYSRRAVGQEERVRAEQAAKAAKAAWDRAIAEDKLLHAGAWIRDKEIARAAIAQARSAVLQAQTEIDRHKVRAPVVNEAGQSLELEVMQVNVRPGEFVGTVNPGAFMVLGNIDRLHVRVDIDEHDIPRFRAGASGKAIVRGGDGNEFPLTFVRTEPFVIPKKSLTGESSERVDTRVLQVLYEVVGEHRDLYVGQQVDVFLADATSTSASEELVKN